MCYNSHAIKKNSTKKAKQDIQDTLPKGFTDALMCAGKVSKVADCNIIMETGFFKF